MSISQVVDGYFFIKKEFISIIDMALHHYKSLYLTDALQILLNYKLIIGLKVLLDKN